MSTDPKELKAGHAPAVKAGGMRISSKGHPPHQATPEQKAEDKKFMEEEQIKEGFAEKPASKALVSGAEVKMNESSHPDSVKQFHEKPRPTMEKPAQQHGHQNYNIQQPRK
ncbi:hypothetical protein [Salmonella sp. s54412]|uniref:hypothetical protein n=1 Tax=Salmonella sp. s54412 TaxID=3160128 RepID=UPI003754E213